MINKSFQLLRTNPLLTTNFKVVVTSDYSLYMESFNSNNELNNVRYKHFLMAKTEYLENKIPYFYKQLPVELAYDVKYDNDNKDIQNDFQYQFDTTYYAGASYVDDQWYQEEFDYLAPLYIRKDSIPSGFIILRVDDPSDYNLNNNNDFELSKLDNSNFRTEIIDNFKCVKYFDMTYTTNLGKWLNLNYTNNDRYPKIAFDYHPEKSELSSWYGMDYITGIYTSKPLFIEDRNIIQTPHFRFEKFLTEGYKRSGLIYPYILNLKFLFDDSPATPTSLRKYSMNRYFGFYVENLDFVGSITSYRTPEMIPETYLINNIILTGSTGITEEFLCDLDNIWSIPTMNPFVEKWDDTKEYYVFIDNTHDFYRDKTISGLYQIVKVYQDGIPFYKVLSDEIMDPYWNSILTTTPSYVNVKTVDINYTNYNIISGISNSFFIDKYIDCNNNEKYMYGDVYLIKINDNYHIIKYSSGLTYSELNIDNKNDLITNKFTGAPDEYKYYIQSDYAINLDNKKLEYWIVGKSSPYYVSVPIEVQGQTPLTFPIYRVKFSDVKDFDFDRVVTNYSDFDYEKSEYVTTNEEKLYANDLNDNSIPKSKRVESVGSTSQYEINNISSEYIAGDELYEVYSLGQQMAVTGDNGIDDKLYDLNDIWRKNQSVVKWGFMGSISHSDYPYKLNNNYDVGGAFNRTIDPFSTTPNVVNKNMDYFYRIGNFYDTILDNKIYFKNQSTNIQYDFISDQIGTGFNLNAYFTLDFDYFTYFFKNKMYYEDQTILYTKNYDKYSVFNYGDDNVSSITLFKGLKIKVKEVKNIYTQAGSVTSILYGDKNYNDYKLSIILNENYDDVNSGLLNNSGNDGDRYIDTTNNGINIILNEKYKNILILINAKITNTFEFLNDLDAFDEKDGLYYGKKKNGDSITYNSSIFTASNFISAINNYNSDHGLYVKYYYIKEINGVLTYGRTSTDPTEKHGMTNIWDFTFQPYMLNIETPINILLNNKCYSTDPFYINGVNEYVATLMKFDDSKSSKVPIYRYSGPYEPIFKDVSLFKGGYFCYNNVTGITTTLTASTYSSSSSSFEIPYGEDPPIGLHWENLSNLNCLTDNYVQITVRRTLSEKFSNYLCVMGLDFSSVPTAAIITDMTLEINRLSNVNIEGTYVKDNYIQLTKDYSDNTTWSDNNAKVGDSFWETTLTKATYGDFTNLLLSGNWSYGVGWTSGETSNIFTHTTGIFNVTNDASIDPDNKSYKLAYIISNYTTGDVNISVGGITITGITSSDTVWFKSTTTGTTIITPSIDFDGTITISLQSSWFGTVLTGKDVKNDNFGVVVQVKVRNIESLSLVLPKINCITLTLYYEWEQTIYTMDDTVYFDNNYKFDETLSDFGKINELIFSKVNDKVNYSNVNNRIYPMIDEFGYEYDSRFIFKSSWDKEFFIKTDLT